MINSVNIDKRHKLTLNIKKIIPLGLNQKGIT